jgi:hypothetical protein
MGMLISSARALADDDRTLAVSACHDAIRKAITAHMASAITAVVRDCPASAACNARVGRPDGGKRSPGVGLALV